MLDLIVHKAGRAPVSKFCNPINCMNLHKVGDRIVEEIRHVDNTNPGIWAEDIRERCAR
jgi:hypothetical protein